MFLMKYWKLILGAILALALVIGGFVAGYKYAEPESKNTTNVVEVDKNKTSVDKVTTIEKKPDGTEVTTIIDKTEIVENKKIESNSTTTAPAPQPKYSLGIYAHANPNKALSDPKNTKPTWSIMAGYRLLGSLWGEAGYNWLEKTITVGGSIKF